jgi:two-component system, OmpR family, sensor kinase
MKYSRSLRIRLSMLFLTLFTIVILGLASDWSLRDSNELSIDVRDRWLPDTRLLGDLNNYSSDFRTAEADTLIAQNSRELAEALRDIGVLDRAVIRAQQGYEQIRHNAEEAKSNRLQCRARIAGKRACGSGV